MDCCAFCTASSYDIKELFKFLKNTYKTTIYRDVVHAQKPGKEGRVVDLFYFPYGATICWGASLDEAKPYLKEIEPYQNKPLPNAETDDFTYSYGKALDLVDDEIILPDADLMTKLAVSHGLAQSVKLGAFEDTIGKAFEKTRHLPEELAHRGRIHLSRKQIRKQMGELFINRSSINLHVDVLDTPEFFWEHPDLEPLYIHTANELDISTRGQILNQRLDVIRELFEMLGNELNTQHSSRLEWIIIWLIFIEVVITLLTHYHIV